MGAAYELRCHLGDPVGEARVAPPADLVVMTETETIIVEEVATAEAVVEGMTGERHKCFEDDRKGSCYFSGNIVNNFFIILQLFWQCGISSFTHS